MEAPISTSELPPSVGGYGVIAPEYYDKTAHPTCFNFLRLSREFITEQLRADGRQRVLEVGAGDSAAAAALHARGCELTRLEITDASAAMLAHSVRWRALGASLYVADATVLPCREASVHWVVASLADPYNTAAFWRAISGALVVGGKAIVTLPSFEWAAAFRRCRREAEFNSARFVLRNGTEVRVPSLIRPLPEQVRMIERAGFAVTRFRSLGADDLAQTELSPKVCVFDGPFSSLVWGFDVIKAPPGLARRKRGLRA